MGYAHIIWVYDDGIRDAKHSKGRWDRLRSEVGEAVLQVSLGGPSGVKSANVLGHGNCVNRSDEVHSTDVRAYLWSGNCLTPLHRVDEDDFAILSRLVSEERQRRAQGGASVVRSQGRLRRVACPNCYTSQAWDGDVRDLVCARCRSAIPVRRVAQALVELFSAPTDDNADGEDGYHLMRWLDETGWGDALRIGRHDWVLAGCPITVEDFSWAIRNLRGAQLSSLSRLLSQSELPPFLAQSALPLGRAAAEHLGNAEVPALDRERLYYILKSFPVADAAGVLRDLQTRHPEEDGDRATPIGGVLAEALERCEQTGIT